MNATPLNTLATKATLPLAAWSLLVLAPEAQAFSISEVQVGDTLDLTGGVRFGTSLAGTTTYEFQKDDGSFASVGSYGNTEVEATSTGSFSQFVGDKPGYEILSFALPATFPSGSSLTDPFLRLDQNEDGAAELAFFLDTFETRFAGSTSVIGFEGFEGTGRLVDASESGSLSGVAAAIAIFPISASQTGYDLAVTVTAIPEPTTLVGSVAALGLGFLLKKRQKH